MNKQVREQEFEREKQVRAHERDAKDMRNDVEKLVKLADRLRKRVKVRVKAPSPVLTRPHVCAHSSRS